MFEGIRDYFKHEAPTRGESSLPINETAWIGNSNIFTLKDFQQYNPDDLIGRKGFGIYRKMMLDEQVKAVVKFRRDAITSRNWFFELQDEDMEEDERDTRIALMKSIIEQMERPKFTDALNGIMSSAYNGFSMTEKTFKQIEWDGKTWWGIKRLRLKPYDTFYFTVDDTGDLVSVHQKVSGKEQEVNIENFIHFVQNPEVDENYGRSELREAYRPYFTKEHTWKFRMIWIERHAGGFKWIEPVEGRTLVPNSPEFLALQDFLSKATVGSSGILPSGVTMKFEWPQNNVAFGEMIKDADLAIAKALLVPNLLGVTPEVGVGSLARAEAQLDAFMWTLDADAGRLEDALNDGVFEEISELNFGGDPRQWPRFKFKPLSDEAKERVVKLWSELLTAGAVTHQDADEDHIRGLLEYPARIEEEEPEGGEIIISGDPADDPERDPAGPPGETVIGRDGKISIANKRKFARTNKVEFKIIARRGEEVIDIGTDASTVVVNDMIRSIMEQLDAIDGVEVTEENDGNPDAEQTLESLAIPGPEKQKLRRAFRTAMRAAWDLGLRHAESELQRSRNDEFTADKKRIKFVREEFFDIRSFVSTGRVTDDVMAVVNSVILQSSKAGRTVTEIKRSLVTQLTAKGLIGEEVVKELLGALPNNIKVPNARLNTTIRTTVFEAINEARFTAFTDPALGGFVKAFEYTSILDSRTTQICNHMDGRTYPVDSDVWTGPVSWRPPNHFNCRSLLIPVTEDENFVASTRPSIFPQEGFS